MIISADYSQIELRIMAHLSQDAGMLRAFANNEDIHRATAAEVFGVERDAVSSEQRRYAKVINFGLIYGMSAFGLAQNLNIERGAAQSYIERYFARYPGVRQYMDNTRNGQGQRLCGNLLWPQTLGAGNQQSQRYATCRRRTRRDQRANARHRRRFNQAGDDCGGSMDQERSIAIQTHHASA